MPLKITYVRHIATGNFIAEHAGQRIMCLNGFFCRITGAKSHAIVGCTELYPEEAAQLGFIVNDNLNCQIVKTEEAIAV